MTTTSPARFPHRSATSSYYRFKSDYFRQRNFSCYSHEDDCCCLHYPSLIAVGTFQCRTISNVVVLIGGTYESDRFMAAIGALRLLLYGPHSGFAERPVELAAAAAPGK